MANPSTDDPPSSDVSQWTGEDNVPTDADWEKQRPYIEELYREKPLKVVVEKMKNERAFKAT